MSAVNKNDDLLIENGELQRQIKALEEDKSRLIEQLCHSQKIEIVGRLTGGVASDFGSMLSVILGHTEIALSWVDSSHHLYENLQEIYKTAEQSADLTRQLLAFARKQSGVPEIQDLNVTAAAFLKLLHRMLRENVELAWEPGKVSCMVKADTVQINQVLANLCVNACEAMVGAGKITISAENAFLDQSHYLDQPDFSPGNYVILTVSDTGCGIDQQSMGKIFEPLYTTKGNGIGLGLTVTNEIVKQNGGFISVLSEPGKGSTFRIHLPGYFEKLSQEPISPGMAMPGHATILLVDDDVALLGMSIRMLQSMGFKVLSLDKPSEAINLVKTNPTKIDLLLTDLVMPEMNGRTLAKEISSLRPDIKCLFMSGYGEKIIARHGLMDSNVNFVAKPFTKIELRDALIKVLGQLPTLVNS
ncbi:MAG: response regulator [Candidatus Riflebacteria bacterium]|nr:response regulator [Candidatus Riflebacteria bacterium]